MRYLFIFWLKNPAAFNDEFWGKFLNWSVVILSWISQVMTS
jgi:hypothetical protein